MKKNTNFGRLLRHHLVQGTDPSGKPGSIGRPKNPKLLAWQLGIDERTVRNWLGGRTIPHDIESIERVLFGDRPGFDKQKQELRAAWSERNPTGDLVLYDTVLYSISKILFDNNIFFNESLLHQFIHSIIHDKAQITEITKEKFSPDRYWRERDRLSERSPISFYEKYWGSRALHYGVTQNDLRSIDRQLFDAIRMYCRHREIDPKLHLPPPSRTRSRTPIRD